MEGLEKKMLVRTVLAAESAGPSTDMHSAHGKMTIPEHQIFKVDNKPRGIQKGYKERRILEQIGLVPELLDERMK